MSFFFFLHSSGRKNVAYFHDIARLHAARIRRGKNFGAWFVCSTPLPYSPNPILIGYYLFLQNTLMEKHFFNENQSQELENFSLFVCVCVY